MSITDFLLARIDKPCPTIGALAAIYADHQDYRAEWRVGGMSDYATIRDEILRHSFSYPLDKVRAARLAADGIMAADTDAQILDIIQAVGDAVEPVEQGVVLMTAYAIVAKEWKVGA